MVESSRVGAKGFYFVMPRDQQSIQWNRAWRITYMPLLTIDKLLGTGVTAASDPMSGLE